MKRLLIVLLLFGSLCFADDFDFRGVNWGVDRETIAQMESGIKTVKRINFKAIPKGNLAYSAELLGAKVNLQYEFDNDALVMAFYIFTESPELKEISYNDPLKYYTDQYMRLKNSLSQKYGPSVELEHWADETYKNMPVSLGRHIVLGHLTLKSIWETDQTVIVLNCLELLQEYNFYRNRIVYYEREYYRALGQAEPVDNLENL